MNIKRSAFFVMFLVLSLGVQYLHAENLMAMEQSIFVVESYVLSQPDEILKERLGDAVRLANYAKSIEDQASISFNTVSSLKPTTGAIIVAIKPGNHAKSWFMSSEYQIPKTIQDDFQKRFKTLRPITVKKGPVVFAMNFTIKGGGQPVSLMEGTPMPMPDEWKQAIKNIKTPLLMPDGVLKYVWP